MIILVDTREKRNEHITKQFDNLKIPYRHKKLDFGDYSFEIDGISYENKIVIELKASLDELASNFTSGRDRFRREFERAFGARCKVYLMVENADMSKIEAHNYRSMFSPIAYKKTLETWCHRFQIELVFCKRIDVAKFILNTFRRYVK
jgi:ERCC4-type nuclease